MSTFLPATVTQHELPSEFYESADEEVMQALTAIHGRWAAKKRITIVLVACARATQRSLKPVFALGETCCERVWYRWKKETAVMRAYTLILERLLSWATAETLRQQDFYNQQYLRNLAMYRAEAPTALLAVMTDPLAKAEARIEAACKLIQFADPEGAGRVPMPGRATVDVSVDVGPDLDAAIAAEMAKLGLPGAVPDQAQIQDGDGNSDSAG